MRDVWAAEWTGAPLTQDQEDLFLCRYIYHCTPSELDEQDADRISRHVKILEIQIACQNA